MQDTIYAIIGDTLSITANINTLDDIIVDRVEFSCNELNIKKDLDRLDNNIYSCKFEPYDTINLKCGIFVATITIYVGDIKTSKEFTLFVQDNINKGEIVFNP